MNQKNKNQKNKLPHLYHKNMNNELTTCKQYQEQQQSNREISQKGTKKNKASILQTYLSRALRSNDYKK